MDWRLVSLTLIQQTNEKVDVTQFLSRKKPKIKWLNLGKLERAKTYNKFHCSNTNLSEYERGTNYLLTICYSCSSHGPLRYKFMEINWTVNSRLVECIDSIGKLASYTSCKQTTLTSRGSREQKSCANFQTNPAVSKLNWK